MSVAKTFVKGDRIAITIPEDDYQVGIGDCKQNLQYV
jgi:hypothetical protein